MPLTCGAINCRSRASRNNIRQFYRIPAVTTYTLKTKKNKLSSLRRDKWIDSLHRPELDETKLKWIRICDLHFITGKPAEVLAEDHPDWVPCLRMGYGDPDEAKENAQRALERYNEKTSNMKDVENPDCVQGVQVGTKKLTDIQKRTLRRRRRLKKPPVTSQGAEELPDNVIVVMYDETKDMELDDETMSCDDPSENEDIFINVHETTEKDTSESSIKPPNQQSKLMGENMIQSDKSEEIESSTTSNLSNETISESTLTNETIPSKTITNGEATELVEIEINSDAIDKCLLKMITIDYQPISLIENRGFLEYTQKLQPLYTPPSRNILSTCLIPNVYLEVVDKLRLMLNTVEYVAITTDIWTSDNNKTYITVTCHFIYNDKSYSPVIATQEICKMHTGANIAETLSSIFNEWQIQNKIITITSDSGVKIKKAATDHLKINHNICVAHTLNLSIQEAIQANSGLLSVLKKCLVLVGHFNYNILASEKLKKAQLNMGVSHLQLKQGVITKWTSILIMLERLLLIKHPLLVVVTDLPNAPKCLSVNDWKIISDTVAILKSVDTITKELAVEKYPSVSTVIPLITGLQNKISNQQFETKAGVMLQTKLINTIDNCLNSLEANKIIAVSILLDPRLKKSGFRSQQNAINAEKWIKEELISILIKKRKSATVEEQLSDVHIIGTPENAAILLLKKYMEMEHLPRTENPLDFYKLNKNVMPELYQLQQKYLCVPATSVSTERIFSKAGRLTNLRRNRLLPKNLDEIIFLNSYFNEEF